jgi:hypothetical protein
VSTKRRTAATLQALDPGEHLGAVIAAIPPELHMRDVAGARLLANPADRHPEELGDRRRIDETLAHSLSLRFRAVTRAITRSRFAA